MTIEYLELNREDIAIIEKMWEKLNRIHHEASKFFSDEYLNKKFIDRKNEILEKAKDGLLKIFIAKDTDTNNIFGYCVRSACNGLGEIDSIFVEEPYRKHKVGNEFMIKSDEFFRINGVKKQILSVYAGNDDVIKFYKKYNYYPKYIILEKKR